MKDLNYFIVQAQESNQGQFAFEYEPYVNRFDFNETYLTTEDGRDLIIYWDQLGYYKDFTVKESKADTMLMKLHPGMVEEVVAMLKHMEIDGETMQYILGKVGLEYQMLNQLVMSQDFDDVEYIWEERKRFQ